MARNWFYFFWTLSEEEKTLCRRATKLIHRHLRTTNSLEKKIPDFPALNRALLARTLQFFKWRGKRWLVWLSLSRIPSLCNLIYSAFYSPQYVSVKRQISALNTIHDTSKNFFFYGVYLWDHHNWEEKHCLRLRRYPWSRFMPDENTERKPLWLYFPNSGPIPRSISRFLLISQDWPSDGFTHT